MTTITANNVPGLDNKNGKKKKAKAEAGAQPAPSSNAEAAGRRASTDETINGTDGANDSPYVKELQKNIRNIKKKLNASQKVDGIIAENPGISLDELVASKKINEDQKVQAQKKPSLQASLTQLEEQIAQYKQFDEDYQKRLATEKATLEESHKAELQKVREDAAIEHGTTSKKDARDNLLVLSRFLRAAAAKRQGGDETSPENRAFEGALLLVYGGEAQAVDAMESLVSGSDEKVPTVDQTPSEFTYNQVRNLAVEYTPYAAEEAWAEDVAQSETVAPSNDNSLPVGTDPTVAHAGLTELDTPMEPPPSSFSNHVDTPDVPSASNIDAGAANAAGSTNWNATLSVRGGAGADENVEIARDPAETDTGITATPAAASGTQSWAEEVAADPATNAILPQPNGNNNDGFREVHHNRGGRSRGGGHGDFRGGNRGRGAYRGDRGEGGGRGGRGGFRGERGGGEGYRGRGRGGGYRGNNRGRGGPPGGSSAAGSGPIDGQ